MSNFLVKLLLTITFIFSTNSLFSIHQIKEFFSNHEKQQNQQVSPLKLRHEKKSHKYWFNKNHPTDFFLSSARQWNYCDYKCLYLQKYNSNKDFVVVVMGAPLKQDFSACYVKKGQEYTLWNQIMTNKFYQQNCGKDDQDWMKSGKFNVKGIYGVGIGTNLNQTEIYK